MKEKAQWGSQIQSGEPGKSEAETRSKYVVLFHITVVAFLDLLIPVGIMGEKDVLLIWCYFKIVLLCC